MMWDAYFTPTRVENALAILDEYKDAARVMAGGTDIMIEVDNNISQPGTLIDISRIPALQRIEVDDEGVLHIRPCVTHNQLATSSLCQKHALALAQAASLIGSDQIRNIATVGGNIMTASPAADTPPALMALGAEFELTSLSNGKRIVSVNDFFTGYRQVAAQPNELITDIRIPPPETVRRTAFVKLANRKSMGIAATNAAVSLSFDSDGRIVRAVVAMGSVAPTVVRARQAEAALEGHQLSEPLIKDVAELAVSAANPITDVRGSAEYRKWMVEVLVTRALTNVWKGQTEEWRPPTATLVVPHESKTLSGEGYKHIRDGADVIEIIVNGKRHRVAGGSNKSLLHLLRDDLQLIGTKEGCGEGECGACTVSLDGKAVMSCLIPAPRAHQCDIVTVEGLAEDGQLSTLQKEFYSLSSVQCGYCTPGLLMSSYVLMQEVSKVDTETIKRALAGNLCRCTGYKRYVDAVENAFRKSNEKEDRSSV